MKYITKALALLSAKVSFVILLLLTTMFAWLTTTKVGGVVLAVIGNKAVKLIVGQTATEWLISHVKENPWDAPFLLAEFLFG